MNELKKTLLTFFFLFSFLVGWSQKTETYLGLNGGHIIPSGYSERAFGGIELTIKFKENFGFYYTILAGDRFFNMPAGPLFGITAGLHLAGDSSSIKSRVGSAIFFTLLTSILPEGVFYELEATKWLSFSPYLSPFQYSKLNDREANPSSWSFAGSGGTRLHFYMLDRRVRLSLYCEYKIRYDDKKGDAIILGASLSVRTSQIESSKK
ncbi:MAG: hypothetical protein WBM13_02005 [Bacteroidia bacterium]